jgi:excisionase family DNA binding protein
MASASTKSADLPTLLRVEEVAEILGFSSKQIRYLLKTGKLKSYRIGIRAIRVAEADVKAYLAGARKISL